MSQLMLQELKKRLFSSNRFLTATYYETVLNIAVNIDSEGETYYWKHRKYWEGLKMIFHVILTYSLRVHVQYLPIKNSGKLIEESTGNGFQL